MRRDSQIIRPIGFKPAEISALINQTVVDQHAEDAAFLWTQRDHAAGAPQYSLKDLADLDERVEAHIDGLRVAGNTGWETAVQAIDMGPGEVFAAGLLAFEGSVEERQTQVLEAACSAPEFARGLISAIGWMSAEAASRVAGVLVESVNPEVRRAGIAGLAIHRLDPGSHLIASISSPDSRLRARALKALAEIGRTDLLGAVVLQLGDSDDDCRFTAAWCAARLGAADRNVISILQAFAEQSDSPHARPALDMALRCMKPSDAHTWLGTLAANPATARLAAIGIGILGDPAFVDRLLADLQDPALARAAAESFSMITGVDLGYADLDADAPDDFSSVPNDDTGEEIVREDPDEDLQWPSSDRIQQWWTGKKNDFQPGVRYLAGRPLQLETLRKTLVDGTQRQRAAAALELALRYPSQPLFEVRERGNRQLQRIARWIS